MSQLGKDIKMLTMFNRKKLELVKKRYGFTVEDFIKSEFGSGRIFENRKVQISRLVNEKPDKKKNFGILELSEKLSQYINKFKTTNGHYYCPTYFVEDTFDMPMVGETLNGKVRFFSKKETFTINMNPCEYGLQTMHLQGLVMKNPRLMGAILIYQNKKGVNPSVNHAFGICTEKKTQKSYTGWIIPNERGLYDIKDYSVTTGQEISIIAKDIDLVFSSPLLQSKLSESIHKS